MQHENKISIGIFTTDRDLRVRSWDPGLVRLSGIGAEEAAGRPLSEVIPDLSSRGLLARFERVLREGTVEVLAPAFHRYLIPCAPRQPSAHFDRMRQKVTIAPIQGEEGSTGLVVTIEDVTQRMERERDLAAGLKSPDETSRLQAATALSQETATGAGHLMGALGDDSWRVRQVAVETLSRHSTRDTVAHLLKTLQKEHGNLSALNSVLQILALSQEDILNTLLAFLTDADPELRIYTAMVLGERRDREAILPLIRALEDADANVRYHAIEALGRLRAQEAVEPLLSLAVSRDFFLSFPALDALARIGDPAAAPRIVPLLQEEMLQAPAAEALGEIGDDRSVHPLIATLNQMGGPAGVVARALCAIHARYERRFHEGDHIADLAREGVQASGIQHLSEALKAAGPDDLMALARVVGWLEGPVVEGILTRLLGEPKVRREVVDALVRMGPRVTSQLMGQLSSDDLEVRQAAVIALGRIGDRKSVPLLIEALNRDPELVVVTAGALAKIGDHRAFEPLLTFLGHPDPGARIAVIGALNSMGHPEMGQRMQVFLQDPDPLTRASASQIVGYFGYPQCADLLLACCRDPVEDVRRIAVEQLPFVEDDRAFETARHALLNDTHRVRAAAAKALGQMDHPEATALLIEALSDPDAWVRYFATRSLSEQGAVEAVNDIASLARTDPAGHVRINAVKVLGRMDGPDAAELVMSLVQDTNEDLAEAALSALGRLRHPQADHILLQNLQAADPRRRITAIQALCEHPTPDRVFSLQWVAASDMAPEVAEAAMAGLTVMATAEAVNAMTGLTTDANRRESAIAALSRLPGHAIDHLRRSMIHSGEATRMAIVEALSRMKRSEATDMIIESLDDPGPNVRLTAVQALMRLGSRKGESRILSLSRNDPDVAVRRAAQQALRIEK